MADNIGEFRMTNAPAPTSPPVTYTYGPSMAILSDGTVLIERIGGDMEDATPEELANLAKGIVPTWILPKLGRKDV